MKVLREYLQNVELTKKKEAEVHTSNKSLSYTKRPKTSSVEIDYVDQLNQIKNVIYDKYKLEVVKPNLNYIVNKHALPIPGADIYGERLKSSIGSQSVYIKDPIQMKRH